MSNMTGYFMPKPVHLVKPNLSNTDEQGVAKPQL